MRLSKSLAEQQGQDYCEMRRCSAAGHRALRFGLRGESMSEEPVVVGDEVEVEFLELGSFKGEVVKVTGSTSFDVHFPCDGST
eukprot:COSAG06_NODE_21514_length_754_cov_1.322137_1_plen_83_part_00